MKKSNVKRTIYATPSGIKWTSGSIGLVLFRDHKTGKRFLVEDMTVSGGRGAWGRYKRIFARRRFIISLNAGGQGVHYAEGIRWDVSTGSWLKVPKPNSYLVLEQYNHSSLKTTVCFQCRWNPNSCKWDEVSIELPQTLYVSAHLKDEPLKCRDCHDGNRSCNCTSVVDLRQRLDSLDEHLVVTHICGSCHCLHTTPCCPKCWANKGDDSCGDDGC